MDTDQKINEFKSLLTQERDALVGILCEVESKETAKFEISASIKLLDGLRAEIGSLSVPWISTIAIYPPVNLPLYSFVLYAFVASLIADNVYMKVPQHLSSTLGNICSVFKKLTANILLSKLLRPAFSNNFASSADAIIFTGKYENAIDILREYHTPLFMFNGGGINPIIVSEDAHIESAVEKTIAARVFNSGQDCCAPDVIFVHAGIEKQFIDLLIQKISSIRTGSYTDPEVRIGKIMRKKVVEQAAIFFEKNSSHIRYGGTTDKAAQTVEPTVLVSHFADVVVYEEFYAPIFNIVIFSADAELERFFDEDTYKEQAMYCSVFGSLNIEIASTTRLNNHTVLDAEDGNVPFGGMGRKASFVAYKGKIIPQPILVTDIIKRYWLAKN